MILPDGVRRKLDGVIDSVPPDKGCDVLDGELSFHFIFHLKLFTHEVKPFSN